jgi:uncharacterized membrane protein YgdD (TMEM256/DUF423 family)
MKKNHVIISALMGALGVALGAFGAHGLKKIISPEMIEIYKTGVLYHLIHAVVLLAISLNSKFKLTLSFYLILTGIILFSFSLYAYSISRILFFAMITPIGGVSFIAGWLSIIYSIVKIKET